LPDEAHPQKELGLTWRAEEQLGMILIILFSSSLCCSCFWLVQTSIVES
jgi:hypothetical protein